MNAITLLKNDHRRITKLLREFEGTSDRAFRERKAIAASAFRELEIHMKAEEEIFYPAVDAAAGPKSRDLVRGAIAEHETVRTIMKELERTEPNAETYAPTFEVLTEKVEQHIQKEEGQMFAAGSKLGPKRLEYLGTRMAGSRRRVPAKRSALLDDTLLQARTVVTRAFEVLRGTGLPDKGAPKGMQTPAAARRATPREQPPAQAAVQPKRQPRAAESRVASPTVRGKKSVPRAAPKPTVLRARSKPKATAGKKKSSKAAPRRAAK